MPSEYRLSRSLPGHGNDVKAVCAAVDADVLVSGGRDNFVRLWSGEPRLGGDASNAVELDAFVNALALWPPGRPDTAVAGTNSGSIYVLSVPELSIVHTVDAHETNVCALSTHATSAGDVRLLSGSWDHTAAVWHLTQLAKGAKPLLHLKGHSGSVWAVVALGDNEFATGSADATIMIWTGDVATRTINAGEANVVRSLLPLAGRLLMSASNDAQLRLWNADTGECLRAVQSTADTFMYSLCTASASPLGDESVRLAVTTSEGGLAELWAVTGDGATVDVTPLQQLRVPAHSAWAAAVLPNNDVAVACSDGKLWLFTLESRRVAPDDVRAEYESSLAVFTASVADQPKESGQTVTIKVDVADGAPKLDLVYKIGEDPWAAAERFVQANDLPTHYHNTVAEFIVANVPAARQTARVQPSDSKVEHGGKHWDYVFDIQVDDGRNLKLPYNCDEDVFYAAQRFLDENELPIGFLDQVAKFIRDQMVTTPGATAADPFTGSARYVPGGGGGGESASAGGDPFTAAGRYVPQAGGSGSAPAPPSADHLRPNNALLPLGHMVSFGREKLTEKARAKLAEANEAQAEADKLTPEQLAAISSLFDTDWPPSIDVIIAALERALTWHMEHLTPVLDALRIGLLYHDVVQYFMNSTTDRGAETMHLLQNVLTSDPPLGTRVMACRAVANACAHRLGQPIMVECMGGLLDVVLPGLTVPKAVAQIAAAACVANCALVLRQRSRNDNVDEIGPKEDCVRSLHRGLARVQQFGDVCEQALLLVLQAAATLLWADRTAAQQAAALGLPAVVRRIQDASPGDNCKLVARDLQFMMGAL